MDLRRHILLGNYKATTNLNSVKLIGSDSSKEDLLLA